MRRVSKSPNAPLSLSTTTAYDGKDVQQQLAQDHYEKCYLCERILHTDFQVEHHKSQAYHPKLRQNWNNLFWSCAYCNGKKGNSFDNILDPISVNIEDEIKQIIDFSQKRAAFTSLGHTDAHEETCEILTRIHNGTNRLRTKREENFFEYIMGVVNNFYRLVWQYLKAPTRKNQDLVREDLRIDKECLGFKYWIVKENSLLYKTFANDIIWNKK